MSATPATDWYQDDHDDHDDGECWQCGGEGFVVNCFEEYACVDPEGGCDFCTRRCDICQPPSPDQQALREVLSDALAAPSPPNHEGQDT